MIININPMSPLAEAVEGIYEGLGHPLVKMTVEEAEKLMDEAREDEDFFTAEELAEAWNRVVEDNEEEPEDDEEGSTSTD